MIFVTVGGQLPFDRLVGAVDTWAWNCGAEVFAQVGNTKAPPRYAAWERFLGPAQFQRKIEGCDAVISHAGMGTILTALELKKPILVMPRRAHLGEHRNDHQWGTVTHLRRLLRGRIARDEFELAQMLADLQQLPAISVAPSPEHSPEHKKLLQFVNEFIRGV